MNSETLLPVTARSNWKQWIGHPAVIGLLLLAPVLWFLPPWPIDETRYLAVAWEMRFGGDFLLPHLNGDLYAQKPPLLFWLINAGWSIAGVHTWVARAMVLGCSIATMLMLERLVLRLTGSLRAGLYAAWLLLGMGYFAAFTNAIMFDVLLTTCVLIALHGVLDLAGVTSYARGGERVMPHSWRGIALTGAGIGLGILAKGPVMLLDILFPALLAAWWADRSTFRTGRYLAALGLAIAVGLALALAWAIPAAWHGGDAYAHAIFLRQSLGRISGSFAHRQGIGWYCIVLPLMVMPWLVALRVRRGALGGVWHHLATRFGLAWTLPTFVAFSLISGKQAHYLLPMLPGVALLMAVALERDVLRVRAGLVGVTFIALGAALAWLPELATQRVNLFMFATMSPFWGGAIAALGIVLLVARTRCARLPVIAVAVLVAVLLIKAALVQGTDGRYDMRRVANEVSAIQQRGQPLVHVGWHQGLYEFAGRLTQPVPEITLAELPVWARQHPDGLVMSFSNRARFLAKPVFAQPFRGRRIAIWNAREAAASGVEPWRKHENVTAEDDEDD